MRKFGITGYVHVGTEDIRASVAQTDDGSFILVHEDGSDAPVETLGGRWRTSGDIVNAAARSGIAMNMSAVPHGIAAHGHAKRKGRKAYKTTRTLRDHAIHMTHNTALVDAVIAGLMVTYNSVETIDSIAA